MAIQPFSSIEKSVKQVLEEKYAPANGKVGGDLSYVSGSGLYVWLGLVPGGGTSDELSGSWAVDIDVFGDTYGATLDHALAIEAAILDGPHRTTGMIIDSIFENVAPAEIPWDDDSVYRISATYVFTARRTGPTGG